MKSITNFAALAAQYDAFLLDLWGVVHDGSNLYPGARECIAGLAGLQRKSLFISNAPRRAFKVENVLTQLGVPRSEYLGAVSSGEAAYRQMAEGVISPGARYFYIGPQRDADVLDGLGFTATMPENAEFVLNVGFGSEEQSADAWTQPLSVCIARNLPMLCLNPDMEVVKITGERYPCAGVIARDYAAMGGKVQYFGKPYADIYTLAYGMLGGVEKKKILAVGDGLHTDIVGANAQGIDCVLITGGILKYELGSLTGEARAAQLQAELDKHGARADFVMEQWRW